MHESSNFADMDGLKPGNKVGDGRYTLVRILGKGGMGIVWLARDERLEEDLALKFLSAEIGHDQEALSDMRRETLKSRKLSHPNIVRIHDLFEAVDEAPFISMEYIDGKSLSAIKAEQDHRLLPWIFVEPLIQQLCLALDFAHSRGIIHRDLKPGNMMIDAKGVLLLADFGLAATAADSLSRLSRNPGQSGTPAYMSPQQMRGNVPQISDDIYALGATIYELLTSKPPFYRGDVYRQVKEELPTPIRARLAELELENAVPASVEALIMACLSKEPSLRPQSAAQVAGWLGLNSQGNEVQESSHPFQNQYLITEQPGTATGSHLEDAPKREEAPSNTRGVPISNKIATAIIVPVLVIGSLLLLNLRKTASTGAAGNQITQDQAPSTLESASQSIFNGYDLTGWEGDSRFWSVRDGAITGQWSEAASSQPQLPLTWKGNQDIRDFELKLASGQLASGPTAA